ncbi:MAG: YhbY family RNA-binding protein [Candidatus Woesearchaeota archaeon]
MDIEQLKKKSKSLDPSIRIGKNGINDNVLNEIKILVKKRQLIKIKILKNCPEDIKNIIERTINYCDCKLIDKIGLTFTIHRGKSL